MFGCGGVESSGLVGAGGFVTRLNRLLGPTIGGDNEMDEGGD